MLIRSLRVHSMQSALERLNTVSDFLPLTLVALQLLFHLCEQHVHLQKRHIPALAQQVGLRQLCLDLPVRGKRVVALSLRVHQLLHELAQCEPHRPRVELRCNGHRKRGV